MSSTASNYDVRKLATGQAVSTLALLLAAAAAYPTLSKSFKESIPILLISVLYGVMMFASSYVEEEQHFWYWATSAWLVLLWVKWYILRGDSSTGLIILQHTQAEPKQHSTCGKLYHHTHHRKIHKKMEPNWPKMGWRT